MSTTTSIQKQLEQLWAKTQSNAGMFPAKLVAIQKNIEAFEVKTHAPLEELFAQMDVTKKEAALKEAALQKTTCVNSVSVTLQGIYKAVKELDNEDLYTYLWLYQEISEVLKTILPELVGLEKDTLANILDEIAITLENTIDVLELSGSYDEYTTLALIKEVYVKIDAFVVQLGKYNIGNEQIDKIRLALQPIFSVIAMVFGNKEQESTTAATAIAETASSVKNEFETSFNASSIIDKIDTNFSQIATEIRNIPLANEIPFQEKDVKEVWDLFLGYFKTFDADDFYDVETALYSLQEKADTLFEFLAQKMQNNPAALQLINTTIKPLVKQWLTLPNDFRPNNWVEVVHVILQNIQFSLHLGNFSSKIPAVVGTTIQKLESILSTLDNDDFKLIVAAKENPYIHSITLPNILEEEPEELEKITLKEIKQNPILQSSTSSTAHTTANEAETANETETTEGGSPLTISALIDYLCFDENYGAFSKLDKEQYVVIYDLYYRQWFSNRLDNIVDNVQELFSIDTLNKLWEELKALLLHEEGVNLGQLISFIIDKGTELLNQLLTFVKDTLTYIIDELFLLVKALIAFFQKVDVPPVAREQLKKLPPFAKMPNEVTLLHVIAAIPYTLWQEFVNYEVPQTQTV